LSVSSPSNEEIAEILDEIAELLEAQNAQHYRAMAYRRAADTLRGMHDWAGDVLSTSGLGGLEALPFVGENLAHRIAEIVETRGSQLLDRLRGEADPETLLGTVPGIGRRLAERIHDRLGLETLEELELAVHDGRLGSLPGFGPSRLRAVSDHLASRLGRRSRRRHIRQEPSVSELLSVDREYREGAESGRLPRIAPKRFNPENERWLPILHTSREGRHYTAVYSNTARAHALGRTHDWVVLFYDGDDQSEGQATVVTEYRGSLRGERVVRGREAECAELAHRSSPEAKAD
jgi:DNA polymerase (family 10)